jgi:translation initiation factor IF-2
VIVVAGDEGIKTQTDEAINQAKAAGVPIIVAINKADKPGFKPEDVYRQLSERELLPEAWGGTTITVNCSATSKMGIKELLEMILLQAEVLELKANPKGRARGTVIESEIQKGLGATATLLVQNGSLKPGDALVIDYVYGKVKTMHDEHGKSLKEATPSYPVRITGLSDLPVAGCEFIVVGSEKEARKLTEERLAGRKRELLNQPSAVGLEGLLQRNAEKQERKVLNVIIKADVQGSIEAIKNSLGKIKSTKAELNIIFAEVGEISESDIQRANASGATILGFHTSIESHADSFIRELQIQVFQFDVIYHLIDKVKSLMTDLLDKIRVETQVGCANVQAIFKSSQLGLIAGCIVTEGSIKRSHLAKLVRNKEVIWQGDISSLKRVQEDVREVTKGIECGILLNHFNAVEVGDQIQTFEVTYIKQEL